MGIADLQTPNGTIHFENGKWSMISPDSGNDQLQKTADELGLKLDDSTKDALVQYVLQEKGNENSMARSLNFNKEQYSAMVEGLKKAGLNPFLAIQGLQGANMMQGGSNQGGKSADIAIARKQRDNQMTSSVIGSILMALAIVVAAAL